MEVIHQTKIGEIEIKLYKEDSMYVVTSTNGMTSYYKGYNYAYTHDYQYRVIKARDTISTQEYIVRWKMKESKAHSTPSGRLFGGCITEEQSKKFNNYDEARCFYNDLKYLDNQFYPILQYIYLEVL